MGCCRGFSHRGRVGLVGHRSAEYSSHLPSVDTDRDFSRQRMTGADLPHTGSGIVISARRPGIRGDRRGDRLARLRPAAIHRTVWVSERRDPLGHDLVVLTFPDVLGPRVKSAGVVLAVCRKPDTRMRAFAADPNDRPDSAGYLRLTRRYPYV